MTSEIRRPVTLKDVAELAGVSISAVSRTFTSGASVGRVTRLKVLDACAQLGYRPNVIARMLATRRSRIIAIVVSYLQNQFYPLFIELSSQMLQKHGYHVLLFVSDEHNGSKSGVDETVLELMQYQVDGIILASVPLSSSLAEQCHAAGIPVVLFNRVTPVDGVHSVASDNVEGGRLVARALLHGGAKRIAFIAGYEDSATNRDRERGFREELARQGRRLFARAVGNYSTEGAIAATRELFATPEGPDAIFVANDHMAFAVIDTLRLELGLRVPEDVAVVGFDNVPQSQGGGYRLTTVKQDIHAMTAAAVDILMNRTEAKVQRIVVPVELIARATTPPLADMALNGDTA